MGVPHEDGVRRATTQVGHDARGRDVAPHKCQSLGSNAGMIGFTEQSSMTISNVNKDKTSASGVKTRARKYPGR